MTIASSIKGSTGKFLWFAGVVRLLCLGALLWIFSAASMAQFVTETDNNGVTLVKYTGTGGAVTIPDNVNTIGRGAFAGCLKLTSVSIPSSINSIGDWAFYQCTGLTHVGVPWTAHNIGFGSFAGCSSLTSVVISAYTIAIGDGAFSDCKSLEAVYFQGNAPILGGGDPFSGSNQPILYHVDNTAGWGAKIAEISAVVAPNTISIINDQITFTGSSGLKGEVIIPRGVTSIWSWAFYGLGVTSVTIPSSVTSIEEYAFYGCNSLTSLIIPESLTSIGDWAFSNCNALTSLTIPESVTSIGEGAFDSCHALTSVRLPRSITRIARSLFFECSGLTSLIIPSGVTSIGEYAFYGCSSLTSVTIPFGVTRIGSWAFEFCSSLPRVTIPASVVSIEDGAFAWCNRLRGIYFQGNAPLLGGGSVFSEYYYGRYLIAYFRPGTRGWGSTYGGISTAMIQPQSHERPLGVIVKTPKAGKVASSFDVSGIASNNQAIYSVTVSLDGGEMFADLGDLANGQTPFSLTGLIPENGKNVLVVQAFDWNGNGSAPVTRVLNYTNNRPQLAGAYNGLLVADPSQTPSNNFSGLATLTVTSSGLFTGKVLLGGFVLPISGIFDNNGDAHFNPMTATALAPISLALVGNGTTPVALGNLSLSIDTTGAGTILGTLTDDNGNSLASLKADLAGFGKKNPVAQRFQRHYTVVIVPKTQPLLTDLSTYPQGYGFGSVTVGANGIVTLKGTLADGTIFTSAAPLSQTYQWPCFAQLYAKTGSIAGLMSLDDSHPALLLKSLDLLWFRSANATATEYPGGWEGGITVDLFGSEYGVPAKAENRSVFPSLSKIDLDHGNATLEFTAISPLGSVSWIFEESVNIAPNNKGTVLASNNQLGESFTWKLTAANGLISGSDTANATTAFKGVILQKDVDTGSYILSAGGYGFFLMPPGSGPEGKGGSGAVRIFAK